MKELIKKVKDNSEDLKSYKTKRQLRNWAIKNGFYSKTNLPRFKFALKNIGIDYESMPMGGAKSKVVKHDTSETAGKTKLKELIAAKKKAIELGAKDFINLKGEILHFKNGQYLVELKEFVKLHDGNIQYKAIENYKNHSIKLEKNGNNMYSVWSGKTNLEDNITSIKKAKEIIGEMGTKMAKGGRVGKETLERYFKGERYEQGGTFKNWLETLDDDTVLSVTGYKTLKELNQHTGEKHTINDVKSAYEDALEDLYNEDNDTEEEEYESELKKHEREEEKTFKSYQNLVVPIFNEDLNFETKSDLLENISPLDNWVEFEESKKEPITHYRKFVLGKFKIDKVNRKSEMYRIENLYTQKDGKGVVVVSSTSKDGIQSVENYFNNIIKN